MRAWMDAVARTHANAVRRRIAREVGIGRSAESRREVQPGLFDGRVERATTLDAADAARGRERDRHITALEGSLDVRLEWVVAAVLIVWR